MVDCAIKPFIAQSTTQTEDGKLVLSYDNSLHFSARSLEMRIIMLLFSRRVQFSPFSYCAESGEIRALLQCRKSKIGVSLV